MNKSVQMETIPFRVITPDDRAQYEELLATEGERGCEYSFANLYLWGRQRIAFLHGHALFFSQFNRRTVYPFPIGTGDKKAVLDAIIADAAARGIPCRITGLGEKDLELIQSLYPDQFRFHCDENSFDYVYDVNDLADLSGKKYHVKRTNLNRFAEEYPNAHTEPLSESNLPAAEALLEEWFASRLQEDPDGDFHMERAAIRKALRDKNEIGMCGLVLMNGERAIALTLGSLLSPDTMDVHFEKGAPDVAGAYVAINCAFARYVRENYPAVRFLNREEDMGIEGLRRAKQSYRPHHMVRKCWACLLEDGYDY